MSNHISKLFKSLDNLSEVAARRSARAHGRRSFLGRLGTLMVGGSLLPMLPFERSFGSESDSTAQMDDTSCEYWAYCSLAGTPCNACGGTPTQCPPGTEPSKVSWVGTCFNPHEKKHYLVSYGDCCGQSSCSEDAMCMRHERERPGYRMGAFNEMNWCMANTSKGVSCSTAVVMSVADDE
jgi:methylamine dehydrogenase light chain